MHPRKLVQGLLTVSIVSGCMAEIPVIATSAQPSLAQAPTKTPSQLSEENIRQVLANIRAAEQKKDVEGVVKFLAPFVSSEITVEAFDSSLTVTLEGKDDHRALLAKTFPTVRESKVIGNQTNVIITSGGQLGIANISSIKAITTQNGERYFSISTDTIRFARINNQLMIVSMNIRGSLAARPPLKS